MSELYELAQQIEDVKEDIRQSIINRGVDCDTSVPFSRYPVKIANIQAPSVYARNEVGHDVVAGEKVLVKPIHQEAGRTFMYNTYVSGNRWNLPQGYYYMWMAKTLIPTFMDSNKQTWYVYDLEDEYFSQQTSTPTMSDYRYSHFHPNEYIDIQFSTISGNYTQRSFIFKDNTITTVPYSIKTIPYVSSYNTEVAYYPDNKCFMQTSSDYGIYNFEPTTGEILDKIGYWITKPTYPMCVFKDNSVLICSNNKELKLDRFDPEVGRFDVLPRETIKTDVVTSKNVYQCTGITDDDKFIFLCGDSDGETYVFEINEDKTEFKMVQDLWGKNGVWYPWLKTYLLNDNNTIRMFKHENGELVEKVLEIPDVFTDTRYLAPQLNIDGTMLFVNDGIANNKPIYLYTLESIDGGYRAIPANKTYYNDNCVTGFATGNVNDQGEIEVLTLMTGL